MGNSFERGKSPEVLRAEQRFTLQKEWSNLRESGAIDFLARSFNRRKDREDARLHVTLTSTDPSALSEQLKQELVVSDTRRSDILLPTTLSITEDTVDPRLTARLLFKPGAQIIDHETRQAVQQYEAIGIQSLPMNHLRIFRERARFFPGSKEVKAGMAYEIHDFLSGGWRETPEFQRILDNLTFLNLR